MGRRGQVGGAVATSGVGRHGGVGLRVSLIISFELSEGIVIGFYARFVKVKDGASGVGLIISCGLAGGGSARFYTRVSRC